MRPLLLAALLGAVAVRASSDPPNDGFSTAEDYLIAKLGARLYQKEARPPTKAGTPLNVDVGFKVVDYDLDFNDKDFNGKDFYVILTSQLWVVLMWNDTRLAWDPKENGDVEKLHLDISTLWKPDILLYNHYATDTDDINDSTYPPVIVFSDGRVLSVSRSVYRVRCHLEASETSEASHCHHLIGSWTYDANTVSLTLGKVEKRILFDGDRPWTLTDVVADTQVKYYPCCEEPYVSITLNMTLHSSTEGTIPNYPEAAVLD